MECVQETLTNGFWPENKTASLDDDFFVNELLDFSNGFSETEEQPPPPPEENEQTFFVFPEKLTTESEKNDDFRSLPETELTLQAEEGLESLEWLSNFVEESFSVYPLTGKLPPNATENRSKPAVTVQEQSYFATPVQTKARTKRGRTGVRVWPAVSPSFNNESSTSSSSSTSSTTTSFSPNNIWHVQSQTLVPFPAKRLYKKKKKNVEGGEGSVVQPRRCTHCGVTKTPQWRAGPHGSKSLCNACGVRYKSGRLLPEYRPACSPTFSSELHSNNHRKVLEMRLQKEAEVDPAGLVQSF